MSWALEWLQLAVRWIHVIAGVSWIGTSFYFNWLNDHFAPPEEPEAGVTGELWAVHGGGFYRVSKYEVAPDRMPRTLHWFKWEAYLTWVSGISLLILVYYLGAGVYLLDPGVSGLSQWAGIGLGLGTLAIGWLVYDWLCRSPLGRRPALLGLVGFLLAAAVAWALTHLLSGRAAYIHVGAMLGTMMAANVFRVIIPGQHQMVDAVREGRLPDAEVGRHAAMRSRHNNYMTLPVLFIMISHHYPITYGHAWNWAILAVLGLIGAATRHFFNLRNAGRRAPWLLPAAALAMVALAAVTSPSVSRLRLATAGDSDEPVSFQEVRAVIVTRCSICHSASPTHPLFDAPPAGIAFDTPEEIEARAEKIYQVTVESPIMPLGNFTGMTDEERALIGRWVRQGASIDSPTSDVP